MMGVIDDVSRSSLAVLGVLLSGRVYTKTRICAVRKSSPWKSREQFLRFYCALSARLAQNVVLPPQLAVRPSVCPSVTLTYRGIWVELLEK